MLVLSRQKDETVVIGGESTLARLLTRQEMADFMQAGVGPSPLAGAIRKVVDLLDQPLECCLVDIRGDKCRLGFEAPKAFEVHRQEVAEAIKRDMRQAALAGGKAE